MTAMTFLVRYPPCRIVPLAHQAVWLARDVRRRNNKAVRSILPTKTIINSIYERTIVVLINNLHHSCVVVDI